MSNRSPLLPLLALTGALAAPATAPAQPQGELAEAWKTLEEAGRAEDPAEEKRLAEKALPILLARLEAEDLRCQDLFVAGEAQVRAGRPLEALRTVERAKTLDCAEADRMSLRAWALEHAPDGTRRGEGAQLVAAEQAWLRAAHLLRERPERDLAAIAGAVANSGELALLRGDHEAAFERSLAGLRIAPTQVQAEPIGLTLVGAGAPLIGEGASLDLVAEHVDEAALLRITDVRLQQLRRELDRDPHDPVTLASVGFYALLVGSPSELYNALRYLREAVGRREDLPDGWYLLGRTHEAREEIEEAREAYSRQIEERPGTPATRLAVNALAYLESQVLSSPTAGERALALLEAEIEKTPAEAPFHETRARLLATLGRKDEACREALLALQLLPEGESRETVLAWRASLDCEG